jgi:hypothetical protein
VECILRVSSESYCTVPSLQQKVSASLEETSWYQEDTNVLSAAHPHRLWILRISLSNGIGLARRRKDNALPVTQRLHRINTHQKHKILMDAMILNQKLRSNLSDGWKMLEMNCCGEQNEQNKRLSPIHSTPGVLYCSCNSITHDLK